MISSRTSSPWGTLKGSSLVIWKLAKHEHQNQKFGYLKTAGPLKIPPEMQTAIYDAGLETGRASWYDSRWLTSLKISRTVSMYTPYKTLGRTMIVGIICVWYNLGVYIDAMIQWDLKRIMSVDLMHAWTYQQRSNPGGRCVNSSENMAQTYWPPKRWFQY